MNPNNTDRRPSNWKIKKNKRGGLENAEARTHLDRTEKETRHICIRAERNLREKREGMSHWCWGRGATLWQDSIRLCVMFNFTVFVWMCFSQVKRMGWKKEAHLFVMVFFFLFKLPQTKLARQVNNNKKMYDCRRSGQMMAREFFFFKKSRDVHNFLPYARESYQFSFRRT